MLVNKRYMVDHEEGNAYRGTSAGLRYHCLDPEPTDLSSDSEPDEPDDLDNFYEITLQVNQNYRIYHLMICDGYADVKFLAEFNNLIRAKLYTNQQYYLYTGDYPFVVTGYTGFYRETGHRPPIEIPEDMTCVIQKPDDSYYDSPQYLLIVNLHSFRDVSLGF